MDEEREGGCACGAVRYRARGAPMIVHCCHCTDCQTETGTAFAVNAVFEADRVAITAGAPEPVHTPSESGEGQTIVRCPTCRVAVWSHYAPAWERAVYLRVGTLDDATAFLPDVHIYTRSKLPWVRLPEGARTAEAFYKPKEVWPPETQDRWRTLMATPRNDAATPAS